MTERIDAGESREVLEALPGARSPLGGMQEEVWLEEGLGSLDLSRGVT